MTDPLPQALTDHLGHTSLQPLWRILRERLERTGHAVHGSVQMDLDDVAADRIGGVLGRRIGAGRVRIRLADLDTALRRSAAGRGLVPVVSILTGAPLSDRPAERASRTQTWTRVWEQLDADLHRLGLSDRGWVVAWTRWLHASGVVTRLGPEHAQLTMRATAATLAEVAGAFDAPESVPMRLLGELATTVTGDAHGLDDGKTTAAMVLRAAALALDEPPPTSSAERRRLWQRIGVETDLVSSSVLVYCVRPPGSDPWSRMMNLRADQGLITYLTLRELRSLDVAFTGPDTVHGCENPQVLQALADAGVQSPLVCVAGNPSGAALALLSRVRLRYHGDFDWPGMAIAGRLMQIGAEPWRLGEADYLEAVDAAPVDARLPLTGTPQPTPWEDALGRQMATLNVAVHEEALIPRLARDLI